MNCNEFGGILKGLTWNATVQVGFNYITGNIFKHGYLSNELFLNVFLLKTSEGESVKSN